MKQCLGPVSSPWTSVSHVCSSDGGRNSCWGIHEQCQAASTAEKGVRMLPRENKGKGCVVQRVKMPPLTKEVRELRWQTGSEALQLLLCVLLQLLHKWENKATTAASHLSGVPGRSVPGSQTPPVSLCCDGHACLS